MRISLFSAALALLCGAVYAQDGDDRDFERFKKECLESEKEGTWKKIEWKEDAEAALKASKESGKPLFVFLVVGDRGRKNASEC